MSPNILKAIGTAIGAGLVALGNSGLEIPLIPGAVLAQVGAVILGWVGLRQPGTTRTKKVVA